MSKSECPGAQGPATGSRFKGIENFLRRVAFNLGNSPSQTEVKIISCIPIDVSDLQQKILYLEKALEDSNSCNNSKRVCPALYEASCARPIMSNVGVSCNMIELDRCPNAYDSQCKLSSKKKSNVSFVAASRSLHDCFTYHPEDICCDDEGYSAAEIASYDNTMKTCIAEETKRRDSKRGFFKKKKKFPGTKKPKTQYIYYARTSSYPFKKSNVVEDLSRNSWVVTRSYLANMINKQYKPKALGGNLSEISKFTSPICRDSHDISASCAYESDLCSCCHGTFHNIDNEMASINRTLRGNHRGNTAGGYYDSSFYDVVPVKEKPVKVRKNFDAPKKREPKTINIKCYPEDVHTKLRTYPIYNPLYVDHHTLPPRVINNYRKAPKIKKEAIVKNIARRRVEVKNINNQIDMDCSRSCSVDFGTVHPKVINIKAKANKCVDSACEPRTTDAECLTNFLNNIQCQTMTTKPNAAPKPNSSDEKTEDTLNQIKTILQSVLQEVKVTTLVKGTPCANTKKDAVVQKGVSKCNIPNGVRDNMPNILQNHVATNMQGHMLGNPRENILGTIPGLQNHTMGTIPGLQTNTLGNPQDNKTYNMQSSIQNTPGSYLANIHAAYPASIQDTMPGNFPGNLPSSKFMNPCTHPTNNMNSYLPSCSKQLNYSQSYYPHLKYIQNCPLFLQTQGRPMCASCYRHSSQVKSGYAKNGATIATNTDEVKEHSKETDKLIKEIYKSMALTMGVVQKDNSLSEYEPIHDFTKHIDKSMEKQTEKPESEKEPKQVTNVVRAMSELFRKKDMQMSSESPNTTESRPVSNEVSVPSQLGTTTTDFELKLRRERLAKFLNQYKHGRSDDMRQDRRNLPSVGTHTERTTDSDTETSSSESETTITFVPQPPKQRENKGKKSLLSKMFNTVKLFKARDKKRQDKKMNKVEIFTIEEPSSDSDDYQTVYSQKIDASSKHIPRSYNLSKHRTHSKMSYKQLYPRDKTPDNIVRKTPYMEQEYRRQWNEKLTFHDNRYRHSSNHRYAGAMPRKSPFFQTYEARPLVVEPKKPVQKDEPMNARRVMVRNQENSPSVRDPRPASREIPPWLQTHKMGINCGEQRKKRNYQ